MQQKQSGKGYPTPELLQRYLEAYQSEGEDGIRRVLREQKEKDQYLVNLVRKAAEDRANQQKK